MSLASLTGVRFQGIFLAIVLFSGFRQLILMASGNRPEDCPRVGHCYNSSEFEVCMPMMGRKAKCVIELCPFSPDLRKFTACLKCPRRDPQCSRIANCRCKNLCSNLWSICFTGYNLCMQACEEGTLLDPAEAFSGITEDPSQVTSDVFREVTHGLLNIFDDTLGSRQVAETSVKVIGNLMNVNLSVSEETAHLSSQLRKFMDNYTQQVQPGADGQVNITTDDIQMKVVVLEPKSNQSDAFTFSPALEDNNQTTMLIKLPPEVLEKDSKSTRLQFMSYSRSQLFVPEGGFSDEYKDGDLLSRQKVISASVGDRPVANLSRPVEIVLTKISGDRNHTCAYWDEAASNWSHAGVRMVKENDTVIVCHSDHLTNFAVLMAPTSTPIPRAHAEALTMITWAGCAISMACLALTIVTYALFKCLHAEKSGKTLLNLCSALLLLNVMFLVGTVDVDGFSRSSCVAVAMLVHFALLASLMWMLVEAADMYQALVTVFSKYQNLYLLKRCLAAWGLPIIVVAITAIVDTDNYFTENRNTKVCLMTAANTPAYYAALLAPGCLIVAINTVVFVFVARVILKPKFKHKNSNKDVSSSVTVAQVRGAFMVLILLGVTWLFGPLAIEDARLVFSYIFCICNSLQGCLIFLFRCLLNPEAQLAWKQLLTTCTLKRRRGPIRSAYTDSSSKSFGNTGPKMGVSGPAAGNKNASSGDGQGGGKSSPAKSDARNSVTTLYSTGNSAGSLPEKGRKSSGGGGPKSLHAHPHQLHSTNGWHPNLNGPPREGSAAPPVGKETPPLPAAAAFLPFHKTDSPSDHGSIRFIDSREDSHEDSTHF